MYSIMLSNNNCNCCVYITTMLLISNKSIFCQCNSLLVSFAARSRACVRTCANSVRSEIFNAMLPYSSIMAEITRLR